MAEEKTLPREQPYKDLTALINFVLRKFFKAVEEDSFLVVEASGLCLFVPCPFSDPRFRVVTGVLP